LYYYTYCVIIQTQQTQINGRNSKDTKHSGGPPEDGRCAVTIPPADLRSLGLYYYTYCVIIQTQRTQISGKNSNGTKLRGGLPEDGREKRPKHVGILYL
jgi:hypothetical protein